MVTRRRTHTLGAATAEVGVAETGSDAAAGSSAPGSVTLTVTCATIWALAKACACVGGDEGAFRPVPLQNRASSTSQ